MDLQNGKDMPSIEIKVVQLSNENRSHALENSSSIHVHSSTNRQNKPANSLVYSVVLFNALDHRWKSG